MTSTEHAHTDRRSHPVNIAQKAHRASSLQLRVADAITKFAGSMKFVYIHAVVFAVWMLVVEKNPWPTLLYPTLSRTTR